MDSNTIEFKVFVDANADIDDSQSRFIAALIDQVGFKVDKAERIKPFGMTGAEIAISFVISVASSAFVHVARDRIDEVARRVSEEIKRPLRVVFKRNAAEKPKNPDDDSDGPGTKPGQ